mmetsp:Transcript_4381/g.15204  ORF Transcript_4381/g.15204 Transcript_4381/m.15204 type:complete len:241 (+) Transcript_4381:420-1142(+)
MITTPACGSASPPPPPSPASSRAAAASSYSIAVRAAHSGSIPSGGSSHTLGPPSSAAAAAVARYWYSGSRHRALAANGAGMLSRSRQSASSVAFRHSVSLGAHWCSPRRASSAHGGTSNGSHHATAFSIRSSSTTADGPVATQSSQNPVLMPLPQNPHPSAVAHHGCDQSSVVHSVYVTPWYVHSGSHVHPVTVGAGYVPSSLSSTCSSRSHSVVSAAATPSIRQGVDDLSYTGTTADAT